MSVEGADPDGSTPSIRISAGSGAGLRPFRTHRPWVQSTPWATMASATLVKPATLAPSIRSPGLPYSLEAS